MSITGGFVSLIIIGGEQPPFGRFIFVGIVIGTGVFVIMILLFVVIL